ncbi:MAG: geranylgeranylglyceryl/heptaprenylglyceryl phosphate synthase [Bacteroidales bacterium]|nr:geranylgeranylglyceryl/heptaprenylglyceryl phosphate synthase [Bacteroidales bacterium]
MKIYSRILENIKKNKKQFAVLIDPDKLEKEEISKISKTANEAGVDFFFVGGSLLTNDNLDNCIKILKQNSKIPVLIFPGNNLQINQNADGILFLSLISGRNAEMLIGKHVIAAPYIKAFGLEVIPTGYMLIDSGKATTASYMSNSFPIPHEKDEIAMCTAMAGEMLGLKTIYMDAGSGAEKSISAKMISKVKQNISVPLIIGGGIKTSEKAVECCRAGADIIVIGNAIEDNFQLIGSISGALKKI